MTPNPTPNRERLYALFNSPGFVVAAIAATAVFLVLLVLLLGGMSPAPAQVAQPTGTPVVVVVQVTSAPPDTPPPASTPKPALPPQPSATALPTLAPTQTPLPTATPTPTPVPLPVWRSIGDLGIVEFTQSTEAEAKVERPGLLQIFGTDRVRLYAVGKIRVGLDLTGMSGSSVQRNGSSITLTLPPVSVLGVEMLPDQSEIRAAERSWIYSEYEGLEIAAMDRAKRQLAEMVANNDSMMSLAKELTLLRLNEYLRSLGFIQVQIQFEGG